MAPLTWTAAMSVGVAPLDTDHKCLIRIINLLEEADQSEAAAVIETVLETLILYARFHFQREEKVMEACEFPGLVFHRSEHEGFARFARSLRERFRGAATPGMARELHEYLTQWLRHHVLIQDMAYRPYVMDLDGIDEIALGAAPPLESLEPAALALC
jgi:hemerythrin-like metal-binding protein